MFCSEGTKCVCEINILNGHREPCCGLRLSGHGSSSGVTDRAEWRSLDGDRSDRSSGSRVRYGERRGRGGARHLAPGVGARVRGGGARALARRGAGANS